MNRFLSILLICGFMAPAYLGAPEAVGSVSRPGSEPLKDQAKQKKAVPQAKPEKIPNQSFLNKVKQRWARFRPVHKDAFHQYGDANQVLADKTLNQEIFDKEMEEKMRARYQGGVAPLEREALSPHFRASPWEVQRYEQSRKDMAEWTVKEIGRDQLKDFVRRRKGESGALDMVASTSGVNYEENRKEEPAEARNTSHREKLAEVYGPPPADEVEESVPTKLKAKVNLLKTQGQLTFINPVVTTSVEARAGAGDNLSVELNRGFSDLEMNSKLRYAVDENTFIFNLNKKITEEVSLDLNSERFTGSKRGASGEKSKETAKLLYSISF